MGNTREELERELRREFPAQSPAIDEVIGLARSAIIKNAVSVQTPQRDIGTMGGLQNMPLTGGTGARTGPQLLGGLSTVDRTGSNAVVAHERQEVLQRGHVVPAIVPRPQVGAGGHEDRAAAADSEFDRRGRAEENRQPVDADGAMAGPLQRPHQRFAEMTGTSGDQNFHDLPRAC